MGLDARPAGPARRAAGLSMLSACAANDYGVDDGARRPISGRPGCMALISKGGSPAKRADLDTAAEKLGEAARASGVREVVSQAFLASVLAGRPDAAALAATLPDNPVAQLVLADAEALGGHWAKPKHGSPPCRSRG